MVLGAILYIYLIWRNLKEDYRDDDLVEFGWFSVLLMAIGGRVGYGIVNFGVWNENILDWWSFWNKPGFDYYGAFLGYALAVYIYSKNKSFKPAVFFNDTWMATIILMISWLVGDLIRSRMNFNYLWQILIWMVSGLVFWWGSKKYRSIGWYKSGKKGFAVLLANIILGILGIAYMYFMGIAWWWVAPVIWSLLSVGGLVILSRI